MCAWDTSSRTLAVAHGSMLYVFFLQHRTRQASIAVHTRVVLLPVGEVRKDHILCDVRLVEPEMFGHISHGVVVLARVTVATTNKWSGGCRGDTVAV